MEPTKRNPHGLIRNKQIALRLMPSERADAERISKECNVTMSCLAREAFLKGLALVVSPVVSPDANPNPLRRASDFSGGEAFASPAGLSEE